MNLPAIIYPVIWTALGVRVLTGCSYPGVVKYWRRDPPRVR